MKIRGVNLGGWLVLEKWMTPSLFKGTDATDETSWCARVGQGEVGKRRLREHWDTFITEEDFLWIASRGLNAVRIPVGHWLFGPPYPYHGEYGHNRSPFVEGGHEVLDRAMDWAAKHGLKVLLDLHAAPGCQNGFDNGGIKDVVDWPKKNEYMTYSLEFLGRIAERYGDHEALWGIEVLNEPRWSIWTNTLKSFTKEAYSRIRKYTDVAVVFSDGFRSPSKYNGFMQAPEYTNVLIDIHRYQCFTTSDLQLDLWGHLGKTEEWADEAAHMEVNPGLYSIVGEWSLGLDLKVVSLWADGPYDNCLDGLDECMHDAALNAYGGAQLHAFEQHNGWFFWSYKTETTPAWCFRECVNRGWLPAYYGEECNEKVQG